MNFVVALYAAILFFILSPNVLLRLPRKGSTKVVAAVHAVVFGVLLFFTTGLVSQLHMMLMNSMMSSKKEGLGQTCTSSNDCSGGEVCKGDICVAASGATTNQM
jgi:hypothetical protein